ncbi:MAG: FkbM family methyltransferase [Provencibacterium sp.]|nr:FkbM family methyltransferase [Provencibacterium sp.]
MELRASEILDKILEQDKSFSVNDDRGLSAEVRQRMQSLDWTALERENQEKLAAKVAPSSGTSDEEPAALLNFSLDPASYQVYLNTLQEYQLTSNKIPRQTRLYWVKRVINKLMRVSTRYQEIFNGAVFRLISLLLEKLTASWQATREMGQHICQNIAQLRAELENQRTADQQKMALQLEELQEKLRAELQAQQALAEELQARFDNKLSALEESYLQKLQKTSELLEKSSEIEALQKRAAGSEEWLKLLSQRMEGQEKWLQAEDSRITGTEKWLESTNKRIDACNEMISITPDMTYQSYSQAGEDLIVTFILSNMKNPPQQITYLDIGCNHYKYFNNTFRFYQKGYAGVLIEANPDMIEDLKKFRPRDTVLNCGIGAEAGKTMDFYRISGGGLSSFNKEFIEATLAHAPDAYIESTIPVQIVSINEVIEKYFSDCPAVLSIDIEGDELPALAAMDFERFRPVAFIVETVEFRQYAALGIKRQDILTFMKSKGYEEYAFTGINSIFVDAGKMCDTSGDAK